MLHNLQQVYRHGLFNNVLEHLLVILNILKRLETTAIQGVSNICMVFAHIIQVYVCVCVYECVRLLYDDKGDNAGVSGKP